MTLTGDLYTCLNTDWDGAIIAKPTFHGNEQNPSPETRHTFINSQEKGNFNEYSSDNTADEKIQNFEITVYEGSEADLEKTIRGIKKALHQKAVTNGYYHINSYDNDIKDQLCSSLLRGHLVKIIGDSEF